MVKSKDSYVSTELNTTSAPVRQKNQQGVQREMINAKGGGYAAYPGLVLICRHIFNYHTVPLNIYNYYVSIKIKSNTGRGFT